MIVTIDGPAGSGKSTTARLVAERLGYKYIDTGATYRAVALAVIKSNIDPMRINEVETLSGKINIEFRDNKVFLDNQDVNEEIRSEKVGRIASLCATYKGVRENMVKLQRGFAKGQSVICEGRDIGTVVFPDADLKIYMDAKSEIRAERRQKEFSSKDLKCVLEEIRERDARDKSRKYSPLKIPENAIIIDTTNLSIEEQVNKTISAIKNLVGTNSICAHLI